MFCTANYLVMLFSVGSFHSDIKSAPSLGVSPCGERLSFTEAFVRCHLALEEDSQETAGM